MKNFAKFCENLGIPYKDTSDDEAQLQELLKVVEKLLTLKSQSKFTGLFKGCRSEAGGTRCRLSCDEDGHGGRYLFRTVVLARVPVYVLRE